MSAKIELDCGRCVSIQEIHVRNVLYGVLAGGYDAVWRARLRALPDVMKQRWGSRAFHVVLPTPDGAVPEKLLRWQVEVLLTSPWTADPQQHGSALVVAFFTSEAVKSPMAEVIADAIRSLDWPALAQDYSY